MTTTTSTILTDTEMRKIEEALTFVASHCLLRQTEADPNSAEANVWAMHYRDYTILEERIKRIRRENVEVSDYEIRS